MSHQPRRRRLLRRPSTQSAAAARAEGRAHTGDSPTDKLQLEQTVKRLQEENAVLKKRLTDLRRAARASTIVKKAPTQAALPRIASAKKSDKDPTKQLQHLRDANGQLRAQLNAAKKEHDIAMGEVNATIKAQNTRAHEMSADINRLTHTVRELQDELKASQDRCQQQANRIQDLEADVKQAREEAAACATIARATQQHARHQGHQRHTDATEKDAQLRRLRHDLEVLESDNERLTQQCLELQRQAVSNKELRQRVKELESQLAKTHQQPSGQAGDSAAQEEWKRMYKEWMEKAEKKIKELQLANQLIQMNLQGAKRATT